MAAFSKVIARPAWSKNEQSNNVTNIAETVPTFGTSTYGQSIWEYNSDTLLSRVLGDNFSKAEEGNPRSWRSPWQSFATPFHPRPFDPLRDRTPSPPPLVPDNGSPESSQTRCPSSNSSDFLSPLPTACSTMADIGSPGSYRTFDEDYDRPEADPNFMRTLLRRSRSLRRQARMRDGDFRESDDELDADFSVTSDMVSVVRPAEVVPTVPIGGLLGGVLDVPKGPVDVFDSERPRPESRISSTPSRLSRRVRPPPPIDTAKKTLRTGERYDVSGERYEVEGGYIPALLLSSDSDMGFEADDEEEGVVGRPASSDESERRLTPPPAPVQAQLAVATKKSYAAVLLAPSPPQGNRPTSRTAFTTRAGSSSIQLTPDRV